MTIMELGPLLTEHIVDNILHYGTLFGTPADDLLPNAFSTADIFFADIPRMLASVLEATVATGSKLESLDVETCIVDEDLVGCPHGWLRKPEIEMLPTSSHITLTPTYGKHLEPAFHNLKSLTLLVAQRYPMVEKQYTALGKALQSAKGLKSLFLDIGVIESVFDDSSAEGTV